MNISRKEFFKIVSTTLLLLVFTNQLAKWLSENHILSGTNMLLFFSIISFLAYIIPYLIFYTLKGKVLNKKELFLISFNITFFYSVFIFFFRLVENSILDATLIKGVLLIFGAMFLLGTMIFYLVNFLSSHFKREK